MKWADALVKIEKRLKTTMTPEITKTIMEQLNKDLIAPDLDGELTVQFLPDDEEEIWINFDRRDWQFSFADGELLGCGTFIG